MTAHVLARRWLAGSPATGRPDLAYVDTGGSGTPVVLQHGLCGSAAQTWELLPTPTTRRFLTLECRGHGESLPGPLDALSIATFATDLDALLAETTSGPVVLGGVSMGAALALRLAVQRPERVQGLILIRPAWLWHDAPANMAPNLEVGQLLARQPPGPARATFLDSATARHLRHAAPDNLASLTGFFTREPVAVTAALLQRLALDGPGVSEAQVRALRVPAVVIGHAQDAIHPLALARTLAQTLAHARCVEVPPKAVDRQACLAGIRAAIEHFLSAQDR